MLFNSHIFIFAFLPITWVVFALLNRYAPYTLALGWLVVASLFFYAFWNPPFVLLLLFSILVNYGLGRWLHALFPSDDPRQEERTRPKRRAVLIGGVVFNLGVIGYFKYSGFFAEMVNHATSFGLPMPEIFLPLGISFFTFQQIAYLVDHYAGETKETRFLPYCLFVTFFPQLIAGPIVHHKEMMPQFDAGPLGRIKLEHVLVGLTIFAIGLFKKVVLADQAAVYATPVFDAAEAGAVLTFVDAWTGALAYTLQLYFDFSGYSDMAIGLARLFGIRLPLNFNSPYKATSIADFWRRWHMTLSRFLRDYVYIALGGNRRGPARRYANLGATMVLGGLWHGAGWTFVFWGALHGLFLIINHGFDTLRRQLFGWRPDQTTMLSRNLSRLVTFLAVVVAWVFFRAETFGGAVAVLEGMAGLNGIVLPDRFAGVLGFLPVTFGTVEHYQGVGMVAFLASLLAIVWFSPNVAQIMRGYRPAIETYPGEIEPLKRPFLRWRPTLPWGVAMGCVCAMAFAGLTRVSEFLYFQF